jgi:hypothetical protein
MFAFGGFAVIFDETYCDRNMGKDSLGREKPMRK